MISFVYQNMNLSQNFIKSPQLVRQLLAASSITSNDTVVEIGPGKGIITQESVNTIAKIIAVEKDRDLIYFLKNKFSGITNLKLINQDFLIWNLPVISFKIFSNIPFSITAPILNKILKSKSKPIEIYFIMQLEAALKYFLSSNFNNQDAILLAPYYDLEILGNIDRTAFTPKPQVDIVFTKFNLKKDISIDFNIYQQFRDFVIYGFNQWKPNIFEIYKKIFSYDQFRKINHQLKINNLKPTQLNISQWFSLFEIYSKFVPETKKDLVSGFEKVYLSKIKVLYT
jgi:23S rRNA (adenine-N6)-dimethyltransferase